jgi:hypothetical protein
MRARRSSRLVVIGLIAANIAWLAGLSRLLGEAAVRGSSAIAPTEATLRTALVSLVVAGIVLVTGAFLLWRWQPARQFIGQTREDLRTYSGMPPGAADAARANRQPIAAAAVGMIVPAVALAALLPGPIAAGVAVIFGLAARVVLVVVMARNAMD